MHVYLAFQEFVDMMWLVGTCTKQKRGVQGRGTAEIEF